jgi:hypothetical protein
MALTNAQDYFKKEITRKIEVLDPKAVLSED